MRVARLEADVSMMLTTLDETDIARIFAPHGEDKVQALYLSPKGRG
jgi:hypothetical protein